MIGELHEWKQETNSGKRRRKRQINCGNNWNSQEKSRSTPAFVHTGDKFWGRLCSNSKPECEQHGRFGDKRTSDSGEFFLHWIVDAVVPCGLLRFAFLWPCEYCNMIKNVFNRFPDRSLWRDIFKQNHRPVFKNYVHNMEKQLSLLCRGMWRSLPWMFFSCNYALCKRSCPSVGP